MPSLEILATFTVAALVLGISPGPSNLYVMARSIAQGSKGGIVAAAGLAVGSLVHIAATVLGLSAIFNSSPTIYLIVKLAGAAYLIYLGVNHWRFRGVVVDEGVQHVNAKPLAKIFRESIIVEVSNPKTALFFIALLPQFVVPEAGPVALQLMILGGIVTLSSLLCDVLVAFFSSKAADWLIKHEKAQLIQERVSGSILLAMGGYIFADEIALESP